jgi:RimJ/RimL family protein N-acetyltransferase/GNAT superfamily N-acetyltransferase
VSVPIRTNRLVLRPVRADDASHLAARRNDPEVAIYQDWSTPFPVERAHTIVAESAALDGPTLDEWWMLTIADHDDTCVVGDVVAKLACDGHVAEIGYTLAREHWGRGYAVEAVGALVTHLFTSVGVDRVQGGLHPDNIASAMVLERVGLRFEGHTKLSYWLDDVGSDDWLYGATRPDWEAWTGRPRHRPDVVRLVEIDPTTAPVVRRLGVHHSQERFVSSVAFSYGDALFPDVIDGRPVEPWLRAVEADGVPAGFVMVARPNEVHGDPYLWRLLVDRLHQQRGIGNRVLDLVIEQCRSWGAASMSVSWVPGRGSPERWYLSRGFVPTGEIDDGEIVARLQFA